MAVSAARIQAGISIAISRDPSLVRTVRLVAAAVARRASSSEDLVEEVRLAVGEACAVMVSGLAGGGATDERVRLQMDIGERLHVSMSCSGDGAPAAGAATVDPWALLRGLAEDLVVSHPAGTTSVSMSWAI